MPNFHIICSDPVSCSAQDIWRMIGFQVNYLGVKGTGVFLQTNSKKTKKDMWRFFSKITKVNHVRPFESTRLPNDMTSEVGTFNGTRLQSRVTSEVGVTDDPDYDLALIDFNEQHPFDDF